MRDGADPGSPADPATGRLFAPADLLRTGTEAAARVAARMLPAGGAFRVARGIGWLAARLPPSRRRALMEAYASIAAGEPEMPAPGAYVDAIMRTYAREQAMYHRLAVRPGWRPDPAVSVEGAEAVEGPLSEGRGVVVWWVPLETMEIVFRLVAHDRGWPYNHVRHWMHGPSPTRWGRAVLNPAIRRVEDRLTGSILLPAEGARETLETARRLLAEGAMVGFRGIGEGRRALVLPFLGGSMRLALGAPVTAMRTGAALVRATLAADEPGPRYTLSLAAMPWEGEAGPVPLGHAFARATEAAVRRSPALWSVLRPQFSSEPPPDENR